MIRRVREWLERFTADEPTPEEIMEIRAREGTLLDDLREAKEGVKKFLHELTEANEDDYVYACYDELSEVEEDWFEKWIKKEEEETYINPGYATCPYNDDDEYWKWHHDDD